MKVAHRTFNNENQPHKNGKSHSIFRKVFNQKRVLRSHTQKKFILSLCFAILIEQYIMKRVYIEKRRLFITYGKCTLHNEKSTPQ